AGVFVLYSGDLNKDENVDLLDQAFMEQDIDQFQSGYFATDINGDGNVDLLDSPVMELNVSEFIYSHHP
ncbi:MAG TPA: dockerin type I domain-containing protein, partial [Chitinophagaceae bacterium]|nr:dockerin type I domain-containing protein [Chitinophagaceae bacterium]